LATALHSGHYIRTEIAQIMALDEAIRLREEDPYTDEIAEVVGNRIIPLRSRFEVDLNRPREKSIYLSPEDAWGLDVWQQPPSKNMIEQSLKEYDKFYLEAFQQLKQLEKLYGHFVVFDLHSYNHYREGPKSPAADPDNNPDVNIGTGTMNRKKWAPLVERFITDLSAYNYKGRHLDVRENIKFLGRQFATWVHTNFPETGCVLSIEFKKIFMDEWTGALNTYNLLGLYYALKSTLPGIAEGLKRM